MRERRTANEVEGALRFRIENLTYAQLFTALCGEDNSSSPAAAPSLHDRTCDKLQLVVLLRRYFPSAWHHFWFSFASFLWVRICCHLFSRSEI